MIPENTDTPLMADQHDRIGELLDALERQNITVEKMRTVLSGIAKANSTDWEIPRLQFKEDFLPWAQNVARGALDSSENAESIHPESKP